MPHKCSTYLMMGVNVLFFITIAMYMNSVRTYCTLNQMTLEGNTTEPRAPIPNCEIVIKKQERYPGTLRHGIIQSRHQLGHGRCTMRVT